uniref:MARVEL domain-containing protein n=1 Tax=Acrobeloides nanus TaxID=290746 RepID=A0A914E8K3_9BILA
MTYDCGGRAATGSFLKRSLVSLGIRWQFGERPCNVQGIVSNILGAIIGGCIVYADRSHKPGGYLPYLIFAAIGIVIYTVFIVFVVKALTLHNGTFYTQSYDYETQHNDSDIDPKIVVHHLRSFHRITCEMIFFMAAVMAFVDWIAIWFWMVVYRAYQYMKGAEEYDRGQTYQVKHNDV